MTFFLTALLLSPCAGKKKSRFAQPLVAFPITNISIVIKSVAYCYIIIL